MHDMNDVQRKLWEARQQKIVSREQTMAWIAALLMLVLTVIALASCSGHPSTAPRASTATDSGFVLVAPRDSLHLAR